MDHKIVEKFVSINGEGIKSGELAVFIRFKACNLECKYCDTTWANEETVQFETLSSKEIYEYIKTTGVNKVTITGGEPLIQESLIELLDYLSDKTELDVEIETNGSISIKEIQSKSYGNIRLTMDYKSPSSLMEDKMELRNFNLLTQKDVVKFVVGSKEDLLKMKKLIEKFDLINRTNVFLSPIFSDIEPAEIVDYMIENQLNDVRLQLQLHKFIWDVDKKGV